MTLILSHSFSQFFSSTIWIQTEDNQSHYETTGQSLAFGFGGFYPQTVDLVLKYSSHKQHDKYILLNTWEKKQQQQLKYQTTLSMKHVCYEFKLFFHPLPS